VSSSELWIWKTAAACQTCGEPVELIGTAWHHAEPSIPHEVEVIVYRVPDLEAEAG
jgi:hypothetical protein